MMTVDTQQRHGNPKVPPEARAAPGAPLFLPALGERGSRRTEAEVPACGAGALKLTLKLRSATSASEAPTSTRYASHLSHDCPHIGHVEVHVHDRRVWLILLVRWCNTPLGDCMKRALTASGYCRVYSAPVDVNLHGKEVARVWVRWIFPSTTPEVLLVQAPQRV